MVRKSMKPTKRTNPITNPVSFDDLHSVGEKRIQRRKANSYYSIHKQSEEKMESRSGIKVVSHKNKNVTYNSQCNGGHGCDILCSTNKARLHSRKKSGKSSMKNGGAMLKLLNQSLEHTYQHLYCSKSKTVMPRRKKMVQNANGQSKCELFEGLYDVASQKASRRGTKRYTNATSKPKQQRSSIQLYKNPMHEVRTESKEHRASIKVNKTKFKRTNTLIPDEGASGNRNCSIKMTPQSFSKSCIFGSHDINAEVENRNSSIKMLSQSHAKTNVFSSMYENHDVVEKRVRQLCPQSHPDTWIY